MARGRSFLLVGLAATVVFGCGGDDSHEVVAGQTAQQEGTRSEVMIGNSPIAAFSTRGIYLYDSVLQAGGESLGEGELEGNALLLSMDDQQVTDLPEPFDVPFDSNAVVAVVGEQVFQFGERCAERVTSDDSAFCEPGGFQAAILSTQSERWETVELPPGLRGEVDAGTAWITDLIGVTTGGTVVMNVVPEGNPRIGAAPIWGYDVPTGEWRHYPDPGVPVFGHCVAGDDIVVSTAVENQGLDPNVTGLELRVTDAAGQALAWEAPFPVLEQTWDYVPYLGCGDTVIVTWGDARQAEGVDEQVAHRLDVEAGAQWERVESLPSEIPVDGYVAADDTVVLLGDSGGGLVLEGTRWNVLDTATWSVGSAQVWDGEQLVVIDPAAPTPVDRVEVPG